MVGWKRAILVVASFAFGCGSTEQTGAIDDASAADGSVLDSNANDSDGTTPADTSIGPHYEKCCQLGTIKDCFCPGICGFPPFADCGGGRCELLVSKCTEAGTDADSDGGAD